MAETDLRPEEFERLVLPCVTARTRRACRWMRCTSTQDDRVADAVGKAWRDWRRLILAGRDPTQVVGGLVALSVRCAMSGRTIVSYVRLDEPLSPWCRMHENGGTLVSLDEGRGGGGEQQLRELIASDGAEPWEEAIARVDFPAWLDTLPLQQRDVLERRMMGETCGAIATHWRCTTGHIANLCCRLHGQYLRWSL